MEISGQGDLKRFLTVNKGASSVSHCLQFLKAFVIYHEMTPSAHQLQPRYLFHLGCGVRGKAPALTLKPGRVQLVKHQGRAL